MFSRKHKLKIDGILGGDTMGALESLFPPDGVGSGLRPGMHWGVDSASPASFPVRTRKLTWI